MNNLYILMNRFISGDKVMLYEKNQLDIDTF